ncbi:BT4734/BF3469 family protein [Polaribacter sp. Z022]|uniref:BT4734/BF3469 family protein n=1 Tax=Polaribacter sp. Z022 TaxID=2927125 RepID=UPI00201FFA00|nr:BT4734/BF3469 family protein [Polaribacter sp. Z022]MCL7753312.1 VirE protein [Polaribacter sp. Z022]
MEISRTAILNKTHYGINIYTYVLRQFYPNQTVLSLTGKNSRITKNPFNDNKESLKISIVNNIAIHKDIYLNEFKGDVFDFAQLYFKTSNNYDLLLKINQTLNLNLKIKVKDHLECNYNDKNTWYARCSFFKAPIRNVFPTETMWLHQIYTLITSNKYKSITNTFRTLKNTKEARKYKANNFDYVTFSGIFKKRSDKELIKHSNLLTIDFDHLENVKELKDKLLSDQYFETELLFTSPSGKGIKWIIRIDISEITHAEYFKAVTNYIKHTYNIEVDHSGKDISRACFLSHDPSAFINKRHQIA